MVKLNRCLLLLAIFTSSINAETLATVTDIQGKVTVHMENSPRGKTIRQTPTEISNKEFIRTYSTSKARVKLVDDSNILLTESSTLEFTDQQNVSVHQGQVLFSINKRAQTNSLNVITKTAVIGVKGTQFLVVADGENSLVHLKEGEVEVKSLAEEFDDFKAEYQRFKKQYLAEFAEFKKSHTMKSGTTISIGSKGIKEIATPDRIEQLYQELNNF